MKLILALTLALSLPLAARPQLSQDEARALYASGRTLRTAAPPPRPWVYFGDLALVEWRRKHLQWEARTGFWGAQEASGRMTLELPAELRGRKFQLQMRSLIRGGTLRVSFVDESGGEICECASLANPNPVLASLLKLDTCLTAPAAPCSLRLEITPHAAVGLESLLVYRQP